MASAVNNSFSITSSCTEIYEIQIPANLIIPASIGWQHCQFCQYWSHFLENRMPLNGIVFSTEETTMNTPQKHTISISISAFLIVFAALLVGACGTKDKNQVATAPPPPAVVVAEVNQKTVPIYSEFVGQTRAEDVVELRARVEGVLQKVYFKEGAPVKKGQLLFTIDKRPFEAAVQSAKAAVAKATSDLAQAQQRTDVLQAQAQLADAQAVLSKTDQDLARIRPLAAE